MWIFLHVYLNLQTSERALSFMTRLRNNNTSSLSGRDHRSSLGCVAMGYNMYDLRSIHPMHVSLLRCAHGVLAVNPYYPPTGRIQRICVDTVDTTRWLHGNQPARQVVPSTDEIVPFGCDDLCILSLFVDQSTLCPCRTLRKKFRRKL